MIPAQTIRFCIMNNELLNICMEDLRMEQLVFERLKGGLVGINAMLYSQTGSYSGFLFAVRHREILMTSKFAEDCDEVA